MKMKIPFPVRNIGAAIGLSPIISSFGKAALPDSMIVFSTKKTNQEIGKSAVYNHKKSPEFSSGLFCYTNAKMDSNILKPSVFPKIGSDALSG